MTEIKSVSEEKKIDLRIYRDISDMLLLPGWKHYQRILEKHIQDQTKRALMPAVLNPEVDGMSQVLCGESAKGAIIGLRLALSLPSGIIEQHKAQSPSAEEE